MDGIKDVKITLVDDNVQFRTVLKRLLQTQFGCKVIAEVRSEEEFMNLSNPESTEVVIVNLMIHRKDGLNAAIKIIQRYPNLKIIAVIMHCDKVYIKELTERGFKGCISKNNLYDKIYEAIVTVRNNQLYFHK